MYLCVVGVMHVGFVQNWLLLCIYFVILQIEFLHVCAESASCHHTVQLRVDSDTLWASSGPLGVGEYTE